MCALTLALCLPACLAMSQGSQQAARMGVLGALLIEAEVKIVLGELW